MKKKIKKVKPASVKDQYWDMVSLKINEVKGMYIGGSPEACNAANAVATLYNKGMEIEVRKKEAAINLASVAVGAIAMGVDIGMHERDINTCLGLETIAHSGMMEAKNLRKDFNARKYIKR